MSSDDFAAGMRRAAEIAWSDEEDRPWEHWGEHRNVVTAQTVAKEIKSAILAAIPANDDEANLETPDYIRGWNAAMEAQGFEVMTARREGDVIADIKRAVNPGAFDLLKAEALLAELRLAAEALGAMPEGYCFCSKNRIGDDSKDHEPECADLRAAISRAKGAIQ